MQRTIKQLILGLTLAGSTQLLSVAHAENLFQVYQHALQADPVLKAAEAEFLATMENKPQALAGLKPQINLSGSTSYNLQHQNNTFNNGFGDTFNAGYNLSVNKVLYHKELNAQVDQASAIISQTQSALEVERQNLIIRVARSYFDYLKAQDNLEFARSEKQAIGRQLAQVNAYFEAGRSPITDVKEAQARFDSATAQQVAANEQLELAKEQLKAITSRYYKKLSSAPLNTALKPPQPNNAGAWGKKALVSSKEVQVLKHAVTAAQSEVDKQRAAKSPKVDLFAQHKGNFNRFDDDTERYDAAVGVQVNVPLYTGGAIPSRIRQARHSLHQAQHQLESRKRQVVQQARSSYLSVISGIAQVKALKQALNSTRTAAKATQAGFEVGTRTAVDVLLSLRETFRAKRDYSTARYDYLLNKLILKQAAGTLNAKDLQVINKLLTR